MAVNRCAKPRRKMSVLHAIAEADTCTCRLLLILALARQLLLVHRRMQCVGAPAYAVVQRGRSGSVLLRTRLESARVLDCNLTPWRRALVVVWRNALCVSTCGKRTPTPSSP